jgi:hypothetical protein
MLLPARWYGTTFNVVYTNEPTQKSPLKAHVLTSRDGFEIISGDWKTSYQKFSPSDVDRIESKKTMAVLMMKPGQRVTTISLSTRPAPCDSLIAALTPTSCAQLPKPEPKFLALRDILPTFKFPDHAQKMQLHGVIGDQTTQLLQLFGVSSGANPAFIDVFSCLLRMRYYNEQVQAIDQAVKSTLADLRRRLIVAWCSGIARCLQSPESPTQERFYAKVAAAAVETVSRACKAVQIACDDLVAAVPQFPTDVEPAVARIMKEAQDALDREASRFPAYDRPGLKVMYCLTLSALAGAVVGMYQVDCDAFAAKVVEYATAVANKDRVEEAKRDVIIAQTAFLKDILCLLDGRRYDEPFQWIYCTWEFREGGTEQP